MSKNVVENMAEETVYSGEFEEIGEVRANPLEVMSVADFSAPAENMMYCTLKNDGSMKSKAAIFNAINSPQKKIADNIGETILLTDIVAHPIKLVDENSGELIDSMRMVLVDSKGVTYEAVSSGMVNAIMRMLQIFGQPDTWDEPIPIKPIQKATRNGNNKVTTLKIEM